MEQSQEPEQVSEESPPWKGRVLGLATALEEIAGKSTNPIEDLVDLAHLWTLEQEIMTHPTDLMVSKDADDKCEVFRVTLQWIPEYGMGEVEGRLELSVTRIGDKYSWAIDEKPLLLEDLEDLPPEEMDI